MAKKPFKERWIGKALTGPIAGTLLKSVPFGIGSLAQNVLSEVTGSEPGTVDKKEIYPQLIKIGFYILLAALAMKGVISWESADQAKEFVSP